MNANFRKFLLLWAGELISAIGDRDRRDQGGKDDAAGKSLRTLDARPAEGTESPTGSADAPVPSTRGS